MTTLRSGCWSSAVAKFGCSVVNFEPFITKFQVENDNDCLHKCCVYSKCRGQPLRANDILKVQQ
jgi:hypothetical protein